MPPNNIATPSAGSTGHWLCSNIPAGVSARPCLLRRRRVPKFVYGAADITYPSPPTLPIGGGGSHRNATKSDRRGTAPGNRWCGNLFETPSILESLVTDSWMKSTWLATSEADIHLQTTIADIQYQRHGDMELTRLFLQHGIKPPMLNTLNRCRMHLQVLLLSDICDGSGTQLLQQFWDKPRPANTYLLWPKSIQPTESDWQTWRTALQQVLHLGRHRQLGHPLGHWFPSNTGWFWDPQTMALWHLTKQGATRHGKIPKRGWTRWFHASGSTDEPPHLTHRATIIKDGNHLRLTGYGSISVAASQLGSPLDLALCNPFNREWSLELHPVGSLD